MNLFLLRAHRTLMGLVLLFALQSAWAQTADPATALKDRLNYIFQPLDKSVIPTGMLSEYGFALVPPEVYNGVVVDSNRVNMAIWRMLYASLYSARIYGTQPLPELKTVNTSIAGYESATGPIPIPVLHLNYSTLKPYAVTNNLLRVQSDQLYDVAGRPESPYLTKTTFAASPSLPSANRSSVSFILRSQLFYTNTGKTLSSTQIDFGDGRGYVTVSWGTNLNVTYSSTGTKIIKVRLTYTDNTTMESHSPFEVTRLTAAARYAEPASFAEAIAATANHAGGTLSVRLSATNTTGRIQKPLLFVEGYDMSRVAPMLVDDYGYRNFLDNLNIDPLPFDLNRELDNIDRYDLIFLNYNNGTDDIRRNAALVQAALQRINALKGSTEPTVILAWSMGGLVSRYALANMEKQRRSSPAPANDHQTRLLVTLDSPHQGANVPLGIQALTFAALEATFVVPIATTAGNITSGQIFTPLDQAVNALSEPASQQMLIHRAGPGNGFASNTFLDGDYRTMVTFPAGSPPPYRVVASSLGSECGVGVLNPYTELVRASGNFFLSPLPWIKRTNWRTEIIVNALPALGESRRISSLRIWTDYRILSLITVQTYNFNRSYTSPSNLLPWDGAPGGTYPLRGAVGTGVPGISINFLPFFQTRLNVTTLVEQFTFVPTVSGLDITTINNAALTATYTNGSNPANPARVDNFITQERNRVSNSFNRSHSTFFSDRNSRWIIGELRGQRLAASCAAICGTGPTIMGPSVVCTNGGTYTVPAYAGATYSWSVSSNLLISSGQNTATLVVRPNGSGTGTINLTIGTPCGSVTVASKSVSLNFTQVTFYDYNTTSLCPGDYVQVEARFSGTATNITWRGGGDLVLSSVLTPTVAVFYANAYFNSGSAIVQFQNGCGETEAASKSYYRGSFCAEYMVYPNPADEVVEITPTSTDELTSTNEFEVKIFDSFGRERLSAKTGASGKEKKLILDVKRLPKGVYVLHIIHKEGITRKQLMISR